MCATVGGRQQRGGRGQKALRALNASWVLPVYADFEDEMSKASEKKSAKRKIA